MLQYTDRGAPEPPTGSFSNPTSSDTAPPTFDGGGGASATDTPFGAGVDGEGAASGDAPARRRRRGSRGGRRRNRAAGDDASPRSDEPRAEARARDEAEPSDGTDGASADGRAGTRKRTRRGRRGSGASRATAEAETNVQARDDDDDAPEEAAEAGTARKKRSRRKRRTSAEAAAPKTQDLEDTDEELDEPSEGTRGDAKDRTRRRRRGSRGGRGRRKSADVPLELDLIPGEEDDLPELPELPDDAEVVSDGEGSRSRRKRGRKKAGKKADEESSSRGRRSAKDKEPAKSRNEKTRASRGRKKETETEEEPGTPSLILVNAADDEEQRVAVVQDGHITDFSMTSGHSKTFVNDIYRGRVVNLETAIGAAFVDFGQGRNGFLHTSDVLSAYGEKDWKLDKLLTTTIDPQEWDDGEGPSGDDDAASGEDEAPAAAKKKDSGRRNGRHRARPRLPISDLLKKGQQVVVQVTKDAIGDKGPTLTTYISIPGRYLVLMPSMTRTGVSRKIEDDKERRRLKRILESLDVPPGMGVIVRTAGVGRTKADLKRDLTYLKSAWEAFGKKLRSGNGPAPLYRESDVAIRTIRDLFTPNTEAVYVDDPEVHKHLVEFTERLMPENVDRVQLHKGPRPLFHTHGVEQDFEKLFARRIELPSGGSIVFDQTEALVAIDVNSGRTRSGGTDFEEIALKTNVEAAPEIARQIRLRDLGGIIVCDFIDMMRQSNMRQVERVFKAALGSDRARSKVGRISQFGLLELTRQRLGPGLTKKLFHTCPRCRGTGRERNIESRAAAILRRLGSALTLKGFTKVEVRAHPEVVDYLRDECSEQVRAFEYLHQREISFHAVPDQIEDSVLRYLRADGREVRPGGRRKR